MEYFTNEWNTDLSIMETILDQIEFYSGTCRRNMLKKANEKHLKNSGSMLFGRTWRGYLSPTKQREKCEKTGLFKTKALTDNQELEKVFNEFSKLHFPDFQWSQVQMNKNYTCPPHRDSVNVGESILVCCGDYTGGLTCVEIDNKIVKYDARDKPVKFNGAKLLHWVERYEGSRYSLVFFNNNKKLLK